MWCFHLRGECNVTHFFLPHFSFWVRQRFDLHKIKAHSGISQSLGTKTSAAVRRPCLLAPFHHQRTLKLHHPADRYTICLHQKCCTQGEVFSVIIIKSQALVMKGKLHCPENEWQRCQISFQMEGIRHHNDEGLEHTGHRDLNAWAGSHWLR